MNDSWTITLSPRVSKSHAKISSLAKVKFLALLKDLEIKGPIQTKWPNFSSLGKDIYHCHIKKGNPTYVVCWRVEDKKNKIIEVYYAGTHENAPY